MSVDPYNEAVRQRFAAPAYAGALGGDSPCRLAKSGDGQRFGIEFTRDGDRVREIRFRASGCPHMIAALDLACETATGQDGAGLAAITAAWLAHELDVPRSKIGRLFLVEDAFAEVQN